MPRLMLLASVGMTAVTLSACDLERDIRFSRDSDEGGAPLKAVSQLECPDHQGPLTRIRTSPDGLSCVYAGPKGAEVTLRLMKVGDNGPDGLLARLERDLNALMPQVAEKLAKAHAAAEAEAEAAAEADARAEIEEARAEAEAEAAERAVEKAELEVERAEALAEKARAMAEGDTREAARAQARADRLSQRLANWDKAPTPAGKGERVDVSMPGVRVNSEGDKANVRLPGITVKSDGDKADVKIGPITIKADESSSRVDIDADGEQVSVRGEDDASEIRSRRKGPGVRASYILVDKAATGEGWRLVGYEARGPEAGPLVVAIVKAKNRREDDVFDSAKDLVRRNAGG